MKAGVKIEPLRNFIYLNPSRLHELFEQSASTPGVRIKRSKVGAGANFGVLNAKAEFELESTHDGGRLIPIMLETVIDALRESGQLAALRPQRLDEFTDSPLRYVYERCIATRVYLPVSPELREKHGAPPELTVWVSNPHESVDIPTDTWDWIGTYLYLVEEGDAAPVEDNEETYKGLLSGVSALHGLVSHASEDLGPHDLGHPLGRGTSEHPIDKLRSYGARVSLEREIETLYQVRYMSDEQGGFDGGKRFNDLLGYPIAILVD